MIKRIIILSLTLILSVSNNIFPQEASKSPQDLISAYKKAASDNERLDSLEALTKLNKTDLIKAKKSLVKFSITVLIDGESSKLRRNAAYLLGELKSARKQLEKAFDNDDQYVRAKAMEALFKIGNKRSLKFFERGFKDKRSEDVRFWALAGLSKTGKSKHVKLFRKALNWKSENARIYAIQGLGKTGSKLEWRYFKSFCDHAEVKIVKACLKAAGTLKAKASIKTVENKMLHQNPEISKAAITALGSFKGFATISALIRFKNKKPDDVNIDTVRAMLKKNKAARQYAVLQFNMNLRKEANERSKKVSLIKKQSVVEILKKGRRKYIVVSARSGEEIEDYWYRIKTGNGLKGYLFGGHITVIDSYK